MQYDMYRSDKGVFLTWQWHEELQTIKMKSIEELASAKLQRQDFLAAS
jgi:hypothetical protein